MFHLEQSIADWRRRLEAGGIASAEVLDELESHLRDGIEEQLRSGTEAKQAFDSAVRRIGTAGALQKEFAKGSRPERALGRAFLRTFYFLSAAAALLINVWTLVSFELSSLERLAGASGVAVFAAYLFGLPFFPLSSRWDVLRPLLAGIMKAGGIIVPAWTLWALLTALRWIHIEIGILPAMAMWCLCAAYGLTALACVLSDRFGGPGGAGGWGPPSYFGPSPSPPNRPPHTALTPLARRALEVAREEALGLGHDYIGTEHLLLGVLSMTRGALSQTLQRGHINIETVRAEILRSVSASPVHLTRTALPLTPRARKALRFAGLEAEALRHRSLGAEHILLGLLLEGGGVAALALKNLGIRFDRMREEVARTRA